jgi:predicted DCC family thiol-disulfide oxidoreductase YuxK
VQATTAEPNPKNTQNLRQNQFVRPANRRIDFVLLVNRTALAESLRATYLRLDARTLGVGRIVLALVMIGDLVRRVPWLRDFYTNAGLIPNHTVLWRPPMPRIFSFFFMASLQEEAVLWFAICFLCFFFFLIGYRTRLFHVLSFVMTTSLHNRILFAENWGTVAMGALLLWTMFLPTGRRFSVDAVLASLRARPDETPEELAAGVPPRDDRPATSLAVLGFLLQISIIYWFNFVHKTGPTWHDGTAIYYVLHQERIITVFGLWLREHAPFAVTRLLTKGTLVIEAAAPFLILTPIFWRWTRPLAAVLLIGMHLGIAALVNVGIFSATMVAYQFFLLTEAQWRWFARIVPTRGRARTVFYDADCGICYLCVRVLARLDVHRRLRFLPNSEVAALPAGFDALLLDRYILVVDRARDRRWTRGDACTEILAALPFGRLWSWPLRLPGIRQLANVAYDLVARNRTRISVWLGLSACGVGSAPRAGTPSAPARSPFGAAMRRRVPLLRELTVALTLVVMAAEVSVANPAVPRVLQFHNRPQWMVAPVMYTHIFQGWSMFAPDAPLSDETIFVDAVTRDGRHVDPYNEVGSRVWSLPVEQVPVRLGHDSFWCDFTLRIPDGGVYHQAFIEWILRYPERTGRPEDQIVKFEVYSLWQDTQPPPGGSRPSNFRKRRFLQWP